MFVKRALLGLFAAVLVSLCLSAMPQSAKALTSTVSPTYPPASGGNGVSSIVVAPDGSTYIGGNFTMIGTTPRNNLAHILADGVTVDPAFDPDVTAGAGSVDIKSMVLDAATNTLYFGGFNFDTVNGSTTRNRIAAVNATTGVVTAFDPNIAGFVSSLQLDSITNILYAGGFILNVNGGTARGNLAAFDTTTSTATSFNPTTDDTVNSLLLDSANSILYTGGDFTVVNGITTRNHVAAFNTGTSVETAFDPNVNGRVFGLALKSNTLYVGGEYTTVNGVTPRNNLAAFDTTTSTATAFDPDIIGGGPGVNVGAILLNPVANTIFATGQFFSVNGGTTRTSIAEFDLATSTATSFDPVPALNPAGSGGGVFAVAINLMATSLYTGGTFDIGVGTNSNLACIGSCVTAPPVPPTPSPTTPTSTSGTLAPTGADTRLPIGIAITSFVLGTVGVSWLILKKKHSSI